MNDASENRSGGSTGTVVSLGQLQEQLLARADTLPRQLGKIARFCIEHPDTVALSKIGELASAIGVHPSAIVRFGQTFGFKGFSDLQVVFRQSMMMGWPDYGARVDRLITSGDRPDLLIDRFVDASIGSLQTMRQSIDHEAIQDCIEKLAKCRQIYVIGQKRSFPAAFYLAYVLRKLNVYSALIESNGGLLMERASWCQADDGLIAVSFSPYAPGTLDVTTELARRGLTIVSITDSRFSPLVPLSTNWLEVVEHDWAGFRTTAATLALAMTIAVGVAEQRGLDAKSAGARSAVGEWSDRASRD